ncbi:MAG: prephenate/arogenate dehydrogenase family protein [Rhodospirillales bacterium]|nr:prephenate/arogenate dehydrogenase family protein [Rhodospirillales bacterium]HIJ42648.1 prephenate/arogenate dehydrogenase family protein [Rhodospirillaceae bacterium]MDP7215190.1 prephenate/arogenate dehydrogenase family protein [Rhodospirillales bacterium]HIJ44665.1 prephenate/arogenate dehydrogenase family protein [Rhodospirillaceae bacterium]HIJ92447.1 prephenate/arogenate dehydrogenase family protein [Rhodospirillaceae bacterium]
MKDKNPTVLFQRIAFIGFGLIGSSLARVVRRQGLAGHIAVCARSRKTLDKARALRLADSVSLDAGEAASGADLVMICTPLSAYSEVAADIVPALETGCIVSDVGSVKVSVLRELGSVLPDGVHLVPGHPVAGTEHSGPEAGSAELFAGRWCILTPPQGTPPAVTERVAELWRRAAMNVEVMDPEHHDQVLAMTSHLPHLIAYSIVDTATDLEDYLKKEVVKFSAGGFRDFTRIAASDPVMWRDILLANKDAVLEVLSRFNEDLTVLQRAIRRGQGDKLEVAFTRTREIRRGVIDAKQD